MIRARYTPGPAHLLVAGGRAVLLPPTAGPADLGAAWAALNGEADLDAVLEGFEEHAVVDADGARVRGDLALHTDESDGDGGDRRVSASLVWGSERPWLPLESGVVRAAAFELVVSPDAPEPEAPAEGAAAAESAGAAEQAGDEARDPEVPGAAATDDEDGDGGDPLTRAPGAGEPTPTVPIAAAVLGDHDGATMLPSEVAAASAGASAGVDDSPLGDHDGATMLPSEVAAASAGASAGVDDSPLGDHDGATKLPEELADIRGDHDGRTVLPGEVAGLTGAADDVAVTTDGVDRVGNTQAIPAPVAPAISAEEAAAGTIVPRAILSNGADVRLDRPVLIGRRPRSVRSVGEHVPHLVTVESPMHDISRNHVEIKIEDDATIATDLNSTNGTLLHRDGEAHRLHPGERTLLIEGDTLDLGEGITVSFQGLP